MATLPTRSFSTIVSNIAAGMQGRVSTFLNFAIGSVLRAIAESYAGVCLWLQSFALEIAKLTRLATSYGSDADSWIADFGIITRLGAQPATGLVTFSRYTAAASAPVIPVGTTVQTTVGGISFAVYADTTNVAYSAAAGGYIMAASTSSVSAPVRAVVAGTIGNIAAGAISLITSSVPGVDTVTNAGAFTNAIDFEADAAFKARFRLAINALAKGTEPAIGLAITSIQTGLQYTIQENTTYGGATQYGYVTVVVDDGSGNISSTLLTAAQNAVASASGGVRAAGVIVGVFAATITNASVTATITSLPGYNHPTVVAQVISAITNNINALGLGNGLPFFDIPGWVMAVPGVQQISALTLNGGTSDIAASPLHTIKAATITVS
jgi:hypothetical protein